MSTAKVGNDPVTGDREIFNLAGPSEESDNERTTQVELMQVVDTDESPFHDPGAHSVTSSAHRIPAWKQFLLRFDPAVMTAIKWAGSSLMILFCVAVVFGIFYSGFTYKNPRLANDCETPFGTILGVSNGVFGYSNCNDAFVSSDSFNITVQGVEGMLVSGLKWQCVEYARRYWMLQGTPEPAIFGNVEGAADIWNLKSVSLLTIPAATVPLRKFRNNGSVQLGDAPPAKKDLLIYDRREGDFPYGHVAVIVDVVLDPAASSQLQQHDNAGGGAALEARLSEAPRRCGSIRVAEQNWASVQWQGPSHNYTREIPLLYDLRTLGYIVDDPDGPIIGWSRSNWHLSTSNCSASLPVRVSKDAPSPAEGGCSLVARTTHHDEQKERQHSFSTTRNGKLGFVNRLLHRISSLFALTLSSASRAEGNFFLYVLGLLLFPSIVVVACFKTGMRRSMDLWRGTPNATSINKAAETVNKTSAKKATAKEESKPHPYCC
eukprot:gene10598-7362_t